MIISSAILSDMALNTKRNCDNGSSNCINRDLDGQIMKTTDKKIRPKFCVLGICLCDLANAAAQEARAW
jgi:hypothetical protein